MKNLVGRDKFDAFGDGIVEDVDGCIYGGSFDTGDFLVYVCLNDDGVWIELDFEYWVAVLN